MIVREMPSKLSFRATYYEHLSVYASARQSVHFTKQLRPLKSKFYADGAFKELAEEGEEDEEIY